MNTREIVLDMLMELAKGETYCHLLIRDVLKKYNYLDQRDKAFIKRVTEGVVERKIELDYVINQFSNTKVNKLKPLIRELLRMSVYQILYMDQVPDSAVCNEAVKLAQKRKFVQLKGFVNGVLRNIARNKETIAYTDLSVKYSMPQFLIDKLMASYDSKTTEKILASFLTDMPVSIRKKESLSLTQWENVISKLESEGIQVEAHPYLSYAYTLKKAEGLGNIESFQKGDFTVQDVSSMLVAECAGIRENQKVLDLCAAPGGKSMHVAEKLKGTGKLYSFDVSEKKTAYILENKERMGYDNIEVEVNDATVYREDLTEAFDVVIADVPCSGIGVIGKKCDIKYRIDETEIKSIVELQKKIMENAWKYVKKGGTLLYSTCTISREENEDMVEWLLNNAPLATESLDTYLPKALLSETTKKGYLQLLPGVHACDGFFIARLKRVE
ncbi:MAG: 16S rRNA (cytosine(967)-C(5))-methyltransferase RsmB [Lachnospiraceae bacterium]|nr:16S rRNA (cytosine(967)-C(5))-methyltransferase RsmB [Lachnospiraceae bacterium]